MPSIRNVLGDIYEIGKGIANSSIYQGKKRRREIDDGATAVGVVAPYPEAVSLSAQGIVAPNLDQCRANFTISGSESTWTNCCLEEDRPNTTSMCPPVQTYESMCPERYFSCADSTKHISMCLPDSMAAGGYGGTNNMRLGNKCCPENYYCGATFDSPCVAMGAETSIPRIRDAESQILTNPMFVTAPRAYPGCDEGNISPTAVGGIVAVVIVGACVLGGVSLWLVRRRLYRNPTQRRRKSVSERMGHESMVGVDGTYKKDDFYGPDGSDTTSIVRPTSPTTPPRSPRIIDFGFGKVKRWKHNHSHSANSIDQTILSNVEIVRTKNHEMSGIDISNSQSKYSGVKRSSTARSKGHPLSPTVSEPYRNRILHRTSSSLPLNILPASAQDPRLVKFCPEPTAILHGITVTREVKVERESQSHSPFEFTSDTDGASTLSASSAIPSSDNLSVVSRLSSRAPPRAEDFQISEISSTATHRIRTDSMAAVGNSAESLKIESAASNTVRTAEWVVPSTVLMPTQPEPAIRRDRGPVVGGAGPGSPGGHTVPDPIMVFPALGLVRKPVPPSDSP